MQINWSGLQKALRTLQSQRRKIHKTVSSVISLSLIAVLGCVLTARVAQAQSTQPPAGSNQPWPPSRFRCSPVTPDTKVPFIETAQLRDLSRDMAYFEGCEDLDTAWTPQSYPNLKYVPIRSAEHQERVRLLLSRLKEYVAAEAEDWVSYVNHSFGATLPPATFSRSNFPNGDLFVSYLSEVQNQSLAAVQLRSVHLGVSGSHVSTSQGSIQRIKRDLTILGISPDSLCVTPVDLQIAFENQAGYLLRPMSVRAAQKRPVGDELAKLGGQWFGYEIYAFSGGGNGNNSGLIRVGFGFKPCAGRVQIDLSKNQTMGAKQ